MSQHPSMREGGREGESKPHPQESTHKDTATCGWLARLRGAEAAGTPGVGWHTPSHPCTRLVWRRGQSGVLVCVFALCVLVSAPEAGVCSRSWRILFCRRSAATRPPPIWHEDGVKPPHATPSRPPLLKGYLTASLSTRSVKTRTSPAALTGKTDWSGPPSHVV